MAASPHTSLVTSKKSKRYDEPVSRAVHPWQLLHSPRKMGATSAHAGVAGSTGTLEQPPTAIVATRQGPASQRPPIAPVPISRPFRRRGRRPSLNPPLWRRPAARLPDGGRSARRPAARRRFPRRRYGNRGTWRRSRSSARPAGCHPRAKVIGRHPRRVAGPKHVDQARTRGLYGVTSGRTCFRHTWVPSSIPQGRPTVPPPSGNAGM